MIKLRLTGPPTEIKKAKELLTETYDVLSISNEVQNRNSSYVRVYADIEIKRACRACGCTQYNACPGGCYWVEYDLCNKCKEELE